MEDPHPVLDPDERRNARNGFLTAPEQLHLDRELVAPLLRGQKSVGQRAASSSFPDEFDEIGDPPLLALEFCFFESDGLRRLSGGSRDFFFDSSENLGQVLDTRELLPDRGEAQGYLDESRIGCCALHEKTKST